jgi:hypothetical protein
LSKSIQGKETLKAKLKGIEKKKEFKEITNTYIKLQKGLKRHVEENLILRTKQHKKLKDQLTV